MKIRNTFFSNAKVLLLLAGALGLPTFGHAADPVQESRKPVVVIALAKVKPGSEQAFKDAVKLILAPTRAEAGNLSYEFHQSIDDPTEFSFIEHWESVAAIDEHMTLPHMQAFFKIAGPLFETGYPQIMKFRKLGRR